MQKLNVYCGFNGKTYNIRVILIVLNDLAVNNYSKEVLKLVNYDKCLNLRGNYMEEQIKVRMYVEKDITLNNKTFS